MMLIPPPFLVKPELRLRYWWPAVTLIAVFAYVYSLGGLHIPKIGDENVYLQITHRTAEAGHWLPLQAADGLGNTKPPLLFWQGLLTSNWGKNWDLVSLRWPSLIFTGLVSLLVFALALRLSQRRETAYIALLSFLAFSSTFQHGRPYLTNMPETLFVFFPAFFYLYRPRFLSNVDWRFGLVAGTSMGLAALYKSFMLLAPGGFSLAWMMWVDRRRDTLVFVRRDSPSLIVMGLVTVSMFLLWPLLDPEPGAILKEFVFGENLSKLGSADYLSGLVSGPYPVFRIWLGHLTNAGLMALPLIALAIHAFRRRATLTREEKLLWIYVLGFIVVYTLPAQRQENYLLPTVPALAVLLGLGWQRFTNHHVMIFALPLALTILLLLFLMNGIDHRVLPGVYGFLSYLPLLLALFLTILVTISCSFSTHLFHAVIFLCFISLSSLLNPFEGEHGTYSDAAQRAVAGQTVYMPSDFRSRYERYRFMLPTDTRIVGYAPGQAAQIEPWLASGRTVAVIRPYNEPAPSGYRILGQRVDLRTRQTGDEVRKILFDRRLDLLFHKEIILQRQTAAG